MTMANTTSVTRVEIAPEDYAGDRQTLPRTLRAIGSRDTEAAEDDRRRRECNVKQWDPREHDGDHTDDKRSDSNSVAW